MAMPENGQESGAIPEVETLGLLSDLADGSIEEELDKVGQHVESPDAEPFKVHDINSADWCMRKLIQRQIRIREIEAAVAAQIAPAAEMVRAETDKLTTEFERVIAPVEAWRATEIAKLDHSAGYLESLLFEWHKELLVQDPKGRVVSLPHGKLRVKKESDVWNIDEKAFIEWARESAPDLVRTKYEIERVPMKQTLKVSPVPLEDGTNQVADLNGEIVESITVALGADRYYAEPKVPDAE